MPLPKLFRKCLTFDLDFRPTDLKIDRDHLLIKDNPTIKFESSLAERSRVMRCTRLERST